MITYEGGNATLCNKNWPANLLSTVRLVILPSSPLVPLQQYFSQMQMLEALFNAEVDLDLRGFSDKDLCTSSIVFTQVFITITSDRRER
jgi:hypothetical protein